MITEYGRIKGSVKDVEDTSNHDQPQDAFYVGDRQQKDFKKCYYCDKKGHVIKDCPTRRTDIERRRQEEECAAFCDDERALAAKVDSILLDDGFAPEFALHVSVDGGDDEAWWLDSACSRHMTSVEGDFENLILNDTPIDVVLADKSVVPALGHGSVRATLRDRRGKLVKMKFENVLYVPALRKRLISVSQMTDRGAEITFKRNSCSLFFSGRTFKFGDHLRN